MMDYLEEAIMGNRGRGDDDGGLIELPPGFRFHPTDEEIITHYLKAKVMNSSFSATAIGEADFNKSEPWDLPKIATMGEKEWYFFSKRDRKYPTGMRTNRATETGYWKATGKDKEIYKLGSKSAAAAGGGGGGSGSGLIGMKKTLVFYKGRAPKGEKSNWVMHEYRLEGQFSYFNLPSKSSKEEWVVSRVFHKGTSGMMKKSPSMNNTTNYGNGNDFYHNNILVDYYSPNNTLPPLMDAPPPNHHHTTTRPPPSSFTNQEVEYKATNTASFSAAAAAASKLSLAYDGLNYTSYFSTPAAYNPPPPQPPTKYTILQDPPPPHHHYGYQPTSEFIKVEQPQFSSSMVSISQDTGGGISTEMNNTEISSSSAGGGAGAGSAVNDDDHLAGYLWDY